MNKDSQQNGVPSKRGIYLLPNLLTTGALFAGFFAIVSASLMRFETAAIAIFVAMLLDGMDGRVARMTNTTSQFGKEYDSLADMVSFGVAPAFVMFEWSLKHFYLGGWVWPKVGWLAAFLFTAAAALRLARFNARGSDQDRRYFQGLPSPAAAGVMVGLVWLATDLQISGADLWWLAVVTTIMTGVFMVSNLSYYSFKEIDVRERIPFVALLAIVGIFILAAIDPPKVFFAIFLVYALSGPVTNLVRWRRKRGRQSTQAEKRAE